MYHNSSDNKLHSNLELSNWNCGCSCPGWFSVDLQDTVEYLEEYLQVVFVFHDLVEIGFSRR